MEFNTSLRCYKYCYKIPARSDSSFHFDLLQIFYQKVSIHKLKSVNSAHKRCPFRNYSLGNSAGFQVFEFPHLWRSFTSMSLEIHKHWWCAATKDERSPTDRNKLSFKKFLSNKKWSTHKLSKGIRSKSATKYFKILFVVSYNKSWFVCLMGD